tara:strand:+ start:979 stop:1191 length:213 start_codon:yes stop_codon:yes gene_type:complete
MNIPESTTGWIVSAQGDVYAATLEDLRSDDAAAAEGGPREIHETEEQVRRTVAWCLVVQANEDRLARGAK